MKPEYDQVDEIKNLRHAKSALLLASSLTESESGESFLTRLSGPTGGILHRRPTKCVLAITIPVTQFNALFKETRNGWSQVDGNVSPPQGC